MSDGLNINISGDASKAEAEFQKMIGKIDSLKSKIATLQEKNKASSQGMITDYKGVRTSIEQADKNLAKLYSGIVKMNLAQKQMGQSPVFPKMTAQIKETESATSSLISKTLSFAGAISLASKGISLYIEYAREMRALSDNLSTISGDATGRASVSGNLSENDQNLLRAKTQSMADIASTSVEKSGAFTEKLVSAGVSVNNLSKYKNAYKSITSTKSQDVGGLAESILTMINKEGKNPNEATEEDITRNVSLLTKAFGLESSHAYNALSGSNQKLSNIDNFALISLTKELNSGNIRVSTSKVKSATEEGIKNKTFKELGFSREAFEKRKTELSQGGSDYIDSTFKIASKTPESITERATTRDTILFGQKSGPTEEQREKYNRQYNKLKGNESNLVGWAMSKIWSQEESYEFEDRLRNLGADKGREEYIQMQYNNESKSIKNTLDIQNTIRQKSLAKKPIERNDSKGVR